ncbi:MAG: hypothetical protein KAJ49_08775 [Arcobacteraceae bacterium]|nr:hypothetical protein [Arcobacteraceae bacterium]
MSEKLKDLIISYIYVISNQPVKLQELLSANQSFNEGMHLDGKKLGFRLKIGRAYLIFLIIINIIMIPIALITHELFKLADCHLSILVAIFITGIIFASFGLFKDAMSDEVAKKRIQMMWKLHFPHFAFEEYNTQVSQIYTQSIEENIKKQDLERYILNKLSD